MMKRSAANQPKGAKSLTNLVNASLFDQLSETIANHSNSSVFACGGTIPIGSESGASNPVTIRWQGAQKCSKINSKVSSGYQLSLPTTDESEIDHLVSYCEPATFGLGDKDVLDKSYRDAVKMDPELFNVSFDLAEHGIIDVICQMLRPGLSSDKHLYQRRIRAVLYKLNIYSGPSGKFRPHVDTPRGEGHFGSLVICLPSKFKGGQLVVRHLDSEMNFDWSDSSDAIHWAAFYSDCEHAVMEVTEGHRITIAYNVYDWASSAGGTHMTSLDPTKLPSYQPVRSLYEQLGFLTKGHRIGYYCCHSYAHTHRGAIKDISRSLKGADMAVKQIFSALGCKVSIKPILNDKFYTDMNMDMDMEIGMEWLNENSEVNEEASEVNEGTSEVDEKSNQSEHESDEPNEEASRSQRESDEPLTYSIVGNKLIPAKASKRPWVEKDPHELLFPHSLERGIKWLNKPCHKERAMTYHAYYGNEGCSVEGRYSNLALLIDIPPYDERPCAYPSSPGKLAKGRKLSSPDSPDEFKDAFDTNRGSGEEEAASMAPGTPSHVPLEDFDDAASGCSESSEDGAMIPGYVGGDCPS